MSGTYKITPPASNHLDEIADYTLIEWGPQQMSVYIDALFARFQWLADNPELGKRRLEFAPDLRSYPEGSHVIFYRHHTSRIDIIGVLHQSRDIERYFDA